MHKQTACIKAISTWNSQIKYFFSPCRIGRGNDIAEHEAFSLPTNITLRCVHPLFTPPLLAMRNEADALSKLSRFLCSQVQCVCLIHEPGPVLCRP